LPADKANFEEMKHQLQFSYLCVMNKIFTQNFVFSHVLRVTGEAGIQDVCGSKSRVGAGWTEEKSSPTSHAGFQRLEHHFNPCIYFHVMTL